MKIVYLADRYLDPQVVMVLQGGFQVTGGGESHGFQHLGDTAVEVIDHPVFAATGFSGILNNRKEFRRLSLLTKRDIRDYGDNLVSCEFWQDDLMETKIGGSSGITLALYFDNLCHRDVQRCCRVQRSSGGLRYRYEGRGNLG